MAKILAPNKEYGGISAGIQFSMGVGETSNPLLIEWFKSKGYTVELDAAELKLPVPDPEQDDEGSELENMTVEELKAYAEENGIDIGQSTSQKGILKKILEAGNKTE